MCVASEGGRSVLGRQLAQHELCEDFARALARSSPPAIVPAAPSRRLVESRKSRRAATRGLQLAPDPFGHDTASGRGGNDVVYGNLGNETVWGESGPDEFYGGDGSDRLRALDNRQDNVVDCGADADYAAQADSNDPVVSYGEL